ncbi:hypothetical protein GCM10011369_05700 [Neiella marina]|uniref:Uncharacterized protein n=1 Tax=Neiella marina TaxID=508461 RepID=A0A8J2U2P6_9GAMM|nr:hypothetical protein [Neiella marina]GGA66934.1 hypothetical protein GCM10011369_05700 [Neiella marina]
MTPRFWKLSQGREFFSFEEISDSIEKGLVYVHADTRAKGKSSVSQGEHFIEAEIGDYFYLTHGNRGVYLLGQFTGPANIFSSKGSGWVDRPFRVIRHAMANGGYGGPQKWWAPNDRSTFTSVPESELPEFEEFILEPFFGICLADYGVEVV